MSRASSETVWAVQYTDTLKTEKEADEAVIALSMLDGFIAGRSIKPTPQKPGWRVQVFFEDNSRTLDLSSVPRSPTAGLPDNMRRVILLPSFLAQFNKR